MTRVIGMSKVEVVFNSRHVVHAELARTDEEQRLGLSGRRALAADHGMLFVSQEPRIWRMQTHSMLFRIDIVFFDNNLIVTDIHHSVPRGFVVDYLRPTRYVLEVSGGWCEGHGVFLGNRAFLSEDGRPVRL